VTVRDEPAAQVGADEPRCPRDENAHSESLKARSGVLPLPYRRR
jgi:hypothetical protein